MDKPKKEFLLSDQKDAKLCLNCGFPNRNSDTHCMFCHTSLVEKEGLVSWIRQTYYVLRWRWQLRQRREQLRQVPRRSILKIVGYFFLGVGLTGFGTYMFVEAVSLSSFSKGLIAVLFLFYGVFTLKTLYPK